MSENITIQFHIVFCFVYIGRDMYKEKILLFLLILAINIAYIYHASRNEKYLTEITPLKVLGTVITN